LPTAVGCGTPSPARDGRRDVEHVDRAERGVRDARPRGSLPIATQLVVIDPAGDVVAGSASAA